MAGVFTMCQLLFYCLFITLIYASSAWLNKWNVGASWFLWFIHKLSTNDLFIYAYKYNVFIYIYRNILYANIICFLCRMFGLLRPHHLYSSASRAVSQQSFVLGTYIYRHSRRRYDVHLPQPYMWRSFVWLGSRTRVFTPVVTPLHHYGRSCVVLGQLWFYRQNNPVILF